MLSAVQRVLGAAKRRVAATSPPLRVPKHEILSLLPPDPVIVEAGAHIGLDTEELAGLWPAGTVHAFEPIPALYRELEARTGRLANVERYPLALGTTSGTTTMWVSSGGTESSSLLAPKKVLEQFPQIEFRDQIEVPVITLDEWAERYRIGRVDFMWLDMQGYELAALKSGESVLTQVRAILLEVSLEEIYEDNPLWPEVGEWLGQRGFEPVRAWMAGNFGDVLVVRPA